MAYKGARVQRLLCTSPAPIPRRTTTASSWAPPRRAYPPHSDEEYTDDEQRGTDTLPCTYPAPIHQSYDSKVLANLEVLDLRGRHSQTNRGELTC